MTQGSAIEGAPARGNATPAPGSDGRLKVEALGGLAFAFLERPIDLPSRKARALLGYLASTRGGRASREHLVGLLWSESSEEKARASLRQAIRLLRQTFQEIGFEGFEAGRSEISLRPEAVRLDVAEVTDAVERGVVHQALFGRERIADSLIAGYEDLDPALRSWLVVQREMLGQKLARGLELQLADAAQAEPGAGKGAAEALLLLDPTHEGACRHLMLARARTGDVASALALYNKLYELLDREYDVEPSEPTQELVVAIKLGEVQAAETPRAAGGEARGEQGGVARPPAADASPRLTLLVGHFDLDGVGDEQKYLCLGFRSELISTLTRFRFWSIVDLSNSALQFNPQSFPEPTYLIHGQLYRDAASVYLVMELKEPASGLVVWSERFVLMLDNYFSAQQKVVRKIAFSLNVHISQERLQRVAGQPDISLDVYDRWLRGHAFVLKWAPDLRWRAVDIFKSIIEDCPQFAMAYSSLVGVLNSNHFIFPGMSRSSEVEREALSLAKKAVEIDPLDSRSQLHLAWSQAMNGEHSIAELGFKLACELNEYDSWTTASAAGGLAFCGRPEIAGPLSEKAIELAVAPVPMVWAYVGCVRYICGDYAGCVQAATQSEDEVLVMAGWKVAALRRLGRPDEARSHVGQLFRRIVAGWRGEAEPSVETMIAWLVGCFPIRDQSILDDLRAQLRAACSEPYPLDDDDALSLVGQVRTGAK
ncbi:DNA-binding transcriptional activator of the SARP family [Tistlia consotensis]|uniref:DNA-binding transcriptional activator of the SARP family n=1 Tax=Tistlia consotensis USBA 355 TaxID=560819 RepID=A0A1Y6BD81_9PROT|nr:BTAD domain-containing putative transcriptional regulator [Tistlia consotensis]SME97657.1 DNA-binding transcriptional activator of the SARP family [Tistlia consotensis USBA 355]SNR57014.1 DNA-binding transcriptional activator of the SARP family [Tistlia consotensis]